MSTGRQRHRGQKQLSMAEKRMLVAQGTHKWCRGRGGCGGKGYHQGRDGVRLPHARCKGDGLIKVKSAGRRRPRPRRRPGGRGRPIAVFVGTSATMWWFLGDWLGTVGYVLAAVLIVALAAIKILGATVRAVSG